MCPPSFARSHARHPRHRPLACLSVPKTREWPEQSWGMKLGLCLENIVRYNNYRKHRPVLEGMGVVYKCNKDTRV